MFRTISLCASWLVLSAGFAEVRADVLVIDDDGGPGVDFTDLQLAVDAATPGDVLEIRAGSYGNVALSKPINLHADAGVSFPSLRITAVPFGSRVMARGLDLSLLSVIDCPGAVLFDQIVVEGFSSVELTNARDVRVHRSSITTTGGPVHGNDCFVVENSRLELVSCQLRAADGGDFSFDFCSGGCGGNGVSLRENARAHIALTSITGGDGGEGDDGFCLGEGGPGGSGVFLTHASAEVIVAGRPEDELVGGFGGSGAFTGFQGQGVRVLQGFARISGVSLPTGTFGGPDELLFPTTPDPTLELVGDAVTGQNLIYRLHSEPGSVARFLLGRTPIVLTQGGIIELLVNPLRQFTVGTVPATGFLEVPFPVSGLLPTGMGLIGQFNVDLNNGSTLKTNSVGTPRL